MSFLNKGLKIILHDERVTDADGNPRTEVFQALGGIVDFVKFINDGKETLNKPIYFEAENADGTVEVALQWSSVGACLRQQHQPPPGRYSHGRLQAGHHPYHQRLRPR